MIVNLQADGWEIVYHRTHALLAAQIAGYWDFGDRTHRLYETIAAISHHDDLEKEWQGDQLTDAGAPLDFTLERETSVEQLHRQADEALYKGRWVALLISMHQCFLNQGSDNPEIADFVKEQRDRQDDWIKELDMTADDAEYAYTFMRWCDRLSLILCQRQVPMGGRYIEVTNGPDDKVYSIYRLDDGDFCVSPWPFDVSSFEVSIDACYLRQLEFESNKDLTAALKTAPMKTVKWKLARSSDD